MGQTALFNTLKAYSVYDKRVGYCQGMGFIIALLLLYMTEEVQSLRLSTRALSLSRSCSLTTIGTTGCLLHSGSLVSRLRNERPV